MNKNKNKLKTVNIHRNDKYNEILSSLESTVSLNSKNEDFNKVLEKTFEDNEVKVFYDCVGGELLE